MKERYEVAHIRLSFFQFSFFNLFFGYIVLSPTWCNWPMHNFSSLLFLQLPLRPLPLPLPFSKALSISYSSIYYCMLWNQYQKEQHIPINTKHIFLTRVASKHPHYYFIFPFPFGFSKMLLSFFCYHFLFFFYRLQIWDLSSCEFYSILRFSCWVFVGVSSFALFLLLFRVSNGTH